MNTRERLTEEESQTETDVQTDRHREVRCRQTENQTDRCRESDTDGQTDAASQTQPDGCRESHRDRRIPGECVTGDWPVIWPAAGITHTKDK